MLNKKNPKVTRCFYIGEKFIGNRSVALILGDNFFFGQSLTKKLIECTKLSKGAKVFFIL